MMVNLQAVLADTQRAIETCERQLAAATGQASALTGKFQATLSKRQAELVQIQALINASSAVQQLAALQATHASCTTTQNALTAERDAALADAAAKAGTITTLNGTVATRDNTIVFLNGTVEARDEQIVTLNSTIANLDAQIAALLAQLPPTETFFAFDQARIGDISSSGFTPLLTVYEAAMVRPGDTAATSPPNAAFLDTFFGNLKAANPSVNRVCLDYEAWSLVTDVNSATGVNTTVVGWYVTLINAAKAHFSDVGLYGEIPERHSIYLNYPVGHATHTTRKNNWFSRVAMMQPMWDAVDTIYPSLYYINPINDDAAKLDMWITDTAALCAQHAPSKKAYPFLLARIHPTADALQPWVDADYWGHTLDKMKELFDGYTLWLDSSEVMATVTAQPWWTRTVEKHTAWELIS